MLRVCVRGGGGGGVRSMTDCSDLNLRRCACSGMREGRDLHCSLDRVPRALEVINMPALPLSQRMGWIRSCLRPPEVAPLV